MGMDLKSIYASFDNYEDRNFEYKIKTNDLDDCINRRDFTKIIDCRTKFWTAFCKARSTLPETQKSGFSTSLGKNKIKVGGILNNIIKTDSFIEEIRRLCLAGLVQRKTTVDIPVYEHEANYYLSSENPHIALKHKSSGCSQDWFSKVIEPALLKLGEFCGAICIVLPETTKIEIVQLNDTDSNDIEIPIKNPGYQKVAIIRFEWQKHMASSSSMSSGSASISIVGRLKKFFGHKL